MGFKIITVDESNKAQYKRAVLDWLRTDFYSRNQFRAHFWHNRETIRWAFNHCKAIVAVDNGEGQGSTIPEDLSDESLDEEFKKMLAEKLEKLVGKREISAYSTDSDSDSESSVVLEDGSGVVSQSEAVIGYMIWSGSESKVEIDIVEVKKAYRRRGIFKRMVGQLIQTSPNVVVLSAYPIPESQVVFENMGWKVCYSLNGGQKYFNAVKPVLAQNDTLPNGYVIAIHSLADRADLDDRTWYDSYTIKRSLLEGSEKVRLKYFQIDIDETGHLLTPLLTSYHYEGYVAVYYDQKLIVDGKAKHLFNNPAAYSDSSLLILDRIEPKVEELKELHERISNARKPGVKF